MRLKEILELLVLKEWTRDELADKLDLSRNTIDRWFSTKEDQRRHPSTEHVTKMRSWLAAARNETRKQPA
jgi:transcriptional regulator with XRE-family HTH domain